MLWHIPQCISDHNDGTLYCLLIVAAAAAAGVGGGWSAGRGAGSASGSGQYTHPAVYSAAGAHSMEAVACRTRRRRRPPRGRRFAAA